MKQKTLFVFAVLVFIIPFLGIPESWKTLLFVCLSFGIAYTAYSNEIKMFFTPQIHHDQAAAEAFSKKPEATISTSETA
jgi:hypothetical protein